MQWRIQVSSGSSEEPREYCLGVPVVRVGRAREADIQLARADVSRVHFTMAAAGDRVCVTDSSRNGTFVRDASGWSRVDGRAEIDMPAELRAGNWTLTVVGDGAAAGQKPESLAALAERLQDDELEATELPNWEQSVMLTPGELPTAHEAIMVFDLCESSVLASSDDRMAYHLKQRLHQIADPILKLFGCRFFKSTGDGFLATFANPAAALDAGITLEQRIHQRNQRTLNAAIHYRIALHYGEVWAIESGGDDIHGNDVNIAFRIESVQDDAFGEDNVLPPPRRDRILASDSFVRSAGEEHLYRVLEGQDDCGHAVLKGISEPVRVHWLRRRTLT